jgi:hypothetical protein
MVQVASMAMYMIMMDRMGSQTQITMLQQLQQKQPVLRQQ